MRPNPGAEPRRGGTLSWMILNRVTPNLLMVALLCGGIFFARSTTKEVFPAFSRDVVRVSVRYPGASPEEVERGIILAIEEAVRGVDGVVEIRSVAGEGSGSVSVEFDPQVNEQKFYSEIQQEIDRITTFPEEAEETEISLLTRRRDVLEVQLYGDIDEWSLRHLAEDVRERLLQREEITLVEFEGARDFEVHVMADRKTLRQYDLTLRDIADAIGRSSVELPAGGVDTKGGEILVRFNERADWARDFADIPIVSTAEGAVLRLGDIAKVTESFEEADRSNAYNGKRAIGIEIFRIGKQTPTSVARAVREAMKEIESILPVGVTYAIEADRSIIYRQRLGLLAKNAAIGLGLVLLLLGAFLEIRLAFWVTMGIPISFLGAFVLFPASDVTFNMISMFAFIIALGIVVDDAIVVGENIYDHLESGKNPVDAAIHGVRQVAMPVTFSILTNIVAFLPLLFVPGTSGKIWRVIPVVVISVFIISWLESLYVLPTHLAHIKDRPGNMLLNVLHSVQQAFSRLVRRLILRVYAPILDACMRVRYLVAAVALAALAVVVSYALSGRMGMTLMPRVESDNADATAILPVGSPESKLVDVRERLEQVAMQVIEENGGEQLAEGVSSSINGNMVRVRAYLREPGVRPISTAQMANLWRERVGNVLEAQSLRFESDRGGPGGGSELSIELSHTEVRVLEEAVQRLAGDLEKFPNVKDIDDGYSPGKEQMEFELKPEGRSLGLTSQDVARQVRHALYGAEALRQQRGRNEIRVRVMLPEEERASEFDIEQIMIRTPGGKEVPLRQIVEVARGRAYRSIDRRDGRRTMTVEADVEPREEANQVVETLEARVLPALQADFPGLGYGFEGRQSDMKDSMSGLGRGFLLALFAIYVLLAIPFRSYMQPVIVMAAIPFGIVGAVVGHYIMDYSLSVISLMGIIALSGVVINDALIMIVFANEQKRSGLDSFRAMHEAGVRRFRPILLTTLTTFGGLAPMIFETSRQARFMIPMAISLGYGLLFATTITLILVPSLYMILDDLERLRSRLAGGEPGADSTTIAQPAG